MHHALILASRILAGIVGIAAFYCAVFLYEDERKGLQNRLENLWYAIDDRAKAIDSTSMALFNKIGDILIGWTNWLFGERLFSLRAFLTSTNLYSVGGAFAIIIPVCIGIFIEHPAYPGEPVTWEEIEVFLIILFAICVLLLMAALPAISKRRVALFFASLPIIYVFCKDLYLLFSGSESKVLLGLLVTLLPIGIQFILIVITRKLFARISQTP